MRIFSGRLSSSKMVNYRELSFHAWKKEISPAQFLGDLDISGVEDDTFGLMILSVFFLPAWI